MRPYAVAAGHGEGEPKTEQPPTMPDYRLYPLQADGRIAGAPLEIFATCDEAATAYALSRESSSDLEVWERDRLVARVRLDADRPGLAADQERQPCDGPHPAPRSRA